MITCTIGENKYTVDFVSGRALREIGKVNDVLEKMRDLATGKPTEAEIKAFNMADAMDTMARWFCLLFQNKFTIDELYDGYPADRIMHDIGLAATAVNNSATEVLSEFPTKPTAQEKDAMAAIAAEMTKNITK